MKSYTPLRYPGGKARLFEYTKSLIEKNFKDDNTCIVNVRETYEIQNYKEPLHMRALEGKLQVKKDANGKWKLDDFAAKYKIISKINY